MRFEWSGFNSMAKQMDGDMEAESMEEAAGKLRKQGIFVSKITPAGAAAPAATPVPETKQPEKQAAPPPAAPAPEAKQEAPQAPAEKAPEAWWEEALADELKAIHDVCGVARKYGAPDVVVQGAAKAMIERAMFATWQAISRDKAEQAEQSDQPATD